MIADLKSWLGMLTGRALATLLGVILLLGWWTLKSRLFGEERPGYADRIPAGFWEADGPTLELDVEANAPARLLVSLSRDEQEAGARQMLVTGKHAFRVRLPRRAAFVIVELGIDDPRPGSTIAWSLRRDGILLSKERAVLESPLKPGYAFCITYDSEDLAAERPLEEK